VAERYKGYRVESVRLAGWDYASEGMYFVTICTKDRFPFFGDIRDGDTVLSEIGKIAQQYWQQLPNHHLDAICDQFVVMPNHLHGIVAITRSNGRSSRPTIHPTTNQMSAMSPQAGSLSVIVRTYKAAVSRWCRQANFEHFAWQARFYDHIIRNDDSLRRIRQYILDNPARWSEDKDNPAAVWM
jgi:REP element-mobilizing transposase RayT